MKIRRLEEDLFSADGRAGGQTEDRQIDRHDKTNNDVSLLCKRV